MKNTDLKTICCDALEDLKAQNILVLDIREISDFADWFIIATASSSRNAKAISNNLLDVLKPFKQHLVGIEGQEDSEWILVDIGSDAKSNQNPRMIRKPNEKSLYKIHLYILIKRQRERAYKLEIMHRFLY